MSTRAFCTGAIALSAAFAIPTVSAIADSFSAEELAIRSLVAQIEVITEDRSDFDVTIEPGSGEVNSPQVRMVRDTLRLEGGRGFNVRGCRSRNNVTEVRLSGGDYVRVSDLPRVIVRAPIGAEVSIDDSAVFGSLGEIGEAELSLDGCSRLDVAAITEQAEINLNGSGDISVGRMGPAEVQINGSGDITIGQARGEFEASVNGSGDIRVNTLEGEVDLSVRGSGDILIEGGRATEFEASIYGSGDIRMAGVAIDPEVSIYGSGDVRIQSLEGDLSSTIVGSGDLRVG